MTDAERRQHLLEKPARWRALSVPEKAAELVAAAAPEIQRKASVKGEHPFVGAIRVFARLLADSATANADMPRTFEEP